MPCIFCGTPKVNRNHVFGEKWIASLVPPGGTFVHQLGTGSPGSAAPDEWGTKKAALVVRCACQPCNSGWIDRLDTKAHPLLTEMNTGRPMSVWASQKLVIAGWVAKTAAPINSLRRQRLSFSEADSTRRKEEQLPPERCFIWIAGASYDEPLFSIRYGAMLPGASLHTRSGKQISARAPLLDAVGKEDHVYLVTFRVHHLVFQMLVPNVSPQLFPDRTAGFEPFSSGRSSSARSGGPPAWPSIVKTPLTRSPTRSEQPSCRAPSPSPRARSSAVTPHHLLSTEKG